MTGLILLVIAVGVFLWFFTQNAAFQTWAQKAWAAVVIGAAAVFGWLISAWEAMPWAD